MNNLKKIRVERGLKQTDLARSLKIAQSTLSGWETGRYEIDSENLFKLAELFNVSIDYILGRDEAKVPESYFSYKNIIPLPETENVPLLGEIACGEPILAEENILDHVPAPIEYKATFALRCKGDSMINARILDGDIVYIHQQPEVENGEIAAVLIDGEVTLKRFYRTENKVTLRPENPLYSDYVYTEKNDIKILGKAIAFTSIIR